MKPPISLYFASECCRYTYHKLPHFLAVQHHLFAPHLEPSRNGWFVLYSACRVKRSPSASRSPRGHGSLITTSNDRIVLRLLACFGFRVSHESDVATAGPRSSVVNSRRYVGIAWGCAKKGPTSHWGCGKSGGFVIFR